MGALGSSLRKGKTPLHASSLSSSAPCPQVRQAAKNRRECRRGASMQSTVRNPGALTLWRMESVEREGAASHQCEAKRGDGFALKYH